MVEDAIAPQHCEGNEVLVNVKAASVQIVDVQICNGYGRMLRRLLSRYFKVRKFIVIVLPSTSV